MRNPFNPKTLIPFSRFSMVELVLCLVVVIVSIVGVLGLFPVGLESNKKTIGTSFATDAGEQFLRFNASKLKTDWDWINVFANSKPGSDESSLDWASTALFAAGNVQIKATSDLNESSDTNSGFFCLQQFSGEEVDFTAILRVWKDRDVNTSDLSEQATLFVEVSWPASVPYTSADREKQVFTMEVFKAPEVSVEEIAYFSCSLTKEHDGGFATTLAAAANEDGTYAVQLIVAHDGCTDADCYAITDYVIEADPSATIDYVGGDGAADASIVEAATSAGDPLDGFKVVFTDGIGGDSSAGWFKVDYTVTSLQEQQFAAKTADSDNMVTFTVEDFEYVLNCDTDDEEEGDAGSGLALDDDYSTDVNTPLFVDVTSSGLANATYNGGMGKGVLKNDESPNGELTAVLVSDVNKGSLTLNADGSFSYTPDQDYVGTDKFVYKAFDGIKMTNVGKVTIIINPPVDPCADNAAPTFADFSLAEATIDTSYSAGIPSANEPIDNDDDDTITLSASGLPAGLSFDAASKTFFGTPTTAGTFSIALTATDSCDNTATAQVSLTVIDPCATDALPVWPNGNFTFDSNTITKDEYFCWGLGSDLATDSDSTLEFTVCDAPEGQDWLYFNSANQIAGTPPTAGIFTWTICASDGCNTVSTEMTLTIEGDDPCATNSAPVWPNGNFTFDSNTISKDEYFCWGLGSDLATDSDDLEFTVCDAPEGQDWLYFNSANQISGTPTTAGTFTWTICASDGCNTVSTEMTLTIEGDNGYTLAGGDLNANPANSSGNIFELTKSDGTVLDMGDMSDYFHANGNTNLSYTGAASEVKIKVKSDGRTINIDGVDVELSTNTRYTFSGNLIVNLRNTKSNPNSWGQAKGHWWISILGTGVQITPTP